ncbi:MAG: helix-turn-helix transcriptional regulator [bacterium]|nr:helix-turn-helix transcriptional regulator [bacterium]
MVAKRLKELRLAVSASQADIARILNISRVAYSFYENGKRQPNLESLSLLATYYNVSVDYLMGRTDIARPAEELTAQEVHLLACFRASDTRGKEAILALSNYESRISALLKHKVSIKKPSQSPPHI